MPKTYIRPPRIGQRPLRRVSVTVDALLLDAAKDLDINLTETFETALREKANKLWPIKYRAAIALLNRDVKENGLWTAGTVARPKRNGRRS